MRQAVVFAMAAGTVSGLALSFSRHQPAAANTTMASRTVVVNTRAAQSQAAAPDPELERLATRNRRLEALVQTLRKQRSRSHVASVR